MKILVSIISIFLFIESSFSQNKKVRDEVLAEGYLLYNSEKASWNGTDIFLEKFPQKRESVGGYFSYTQDNFHSCIFFDRSDNPKLLAKITFDNEFDVKNAKIDTIQRRLNDLENDLFTIRQKALKEINQDTIFKTYENTTLNPIPIITSRERKVFVLTGPQISGVVVLGNDYLLTFDKNNKLKNKRALHKNIIPIDYNEKTKDAVTMHTHLESTGDIITSTDLCTLMLYKDYLNWKQHIVISNKNVSLWEFDNEHLIIMTKEAWKKISNFANQKKD